MSRIRSVHPGLWTDERFVTASPIARLFFMGLWNECDDYGSFEWAPLKLKMRLLPADNTDAAELLAELEQAGSVLKYEIGGKSYGAVRNFCQYQRPKKPVASYPQSEGVAAFVNATAREEDAELAFRRELCKAQDDKCAYCSAEITHYSKRHNSMEVDHVVPLACGGTDDRANLVASCRACNRAKGKMTADEYRDWMRHRRDKDASSGFASQRKEEGGNREIEISSNEDSSVETDKPLTVDEIVEAWNTRMVPQGFPAVRRLTDARRKSLKARLRENTIDDFQRAFAALERSEFCRGHGPNGWRADFDFLLQPKSFTKLLEGAYDG